jgi:hypothetical protein
MTKLDQTLQNLSERPVSDASRKAIQQALEQIHETPQLPPLPIKHRWRWVPRAVILALGLALIVGLGWHYLSPVQSNIDQVPNSFKNTTFTPPSVPGTAAQTQTNNGITLTLKQAYADPNGYGFTLILPAALTAPDTHKTAVDLIWQAGGTLTSPGFQDDTFAKDDLAWAKQKNIAAVFDPDAPETGIGPALTTVHQQGQTLSINEVQSGNPANTPATVYIRRLYLGGKVYTGDWEFHIDPVSDTTHTLTGSHDTITATLQTSRAGSVLSFVYPASLGKEKEPPTELIINNHSISPTQISMTNLHNGTIRVTTPFALTSSSIKGPVQVQIGKTTIPLQ